jgi:hypothetical protein
VCFRSRRPKSEKASRLRRKSSQELGILRKEWEKRLENTLELVDLRDSKINPEPEFIKHVRQPVSLVQFDGSYHPTKTFEGSLRKGWIQQDDKGDWRVMIHQITIVAPDMTIREFERAQVASRPSWSNDSPLSNPLQRPKAPRAMLNINTSFSSTTPGALTRTPRWPNPGSNYQSHNS